MADYTGNGTNAGRTNGTGGNGTGKHSNGSGNGHAGNADPNGFDDDPDDTEQLRQQYRRSKKAKPQNQWKDLDLGEWDFGAANIVASQLPPRGWLLGTWLCRQFVSSLVGDGAAGKTAHRIACALSLATGRPLLGQHVFERVPVLFVCFEDGETELKRRICAAMLHHGISNEEITGYLFVRAITNSELKLAVTDDYAKTERGPLIAALDAAIIRRKPGAVFLDPLVKTHAVNENSNSAMDLVIEILADMAIRHDIAVDTPHHVSKGQADPGNADRGRGATAVKDGGRLVYTLCPMSEAEAEGFGIDPRERKRFVRVDDAKLNLAAPGAETKWFKLIGVPLGNTFDPRYPHGDNIQTLEPWTPPDPFKDLQRSKIGEVFAAFRDGLGNGEFYAFNRNARERWAGNVIMAVMGKSEGEAIRMLADWKKSKTLIDGDYISPKERAARHRIIVYDPKAIEIAGPFYSPTGAPE
jgi:hypothetical protein